MKDVQKDGKYHEQRLSAVSLEMRHIRADITEHYLKIDKDWAIQSITML